MLAYFIANDIDRRRDRALRTQTTYTRNLSSRDKAWQRTRGIKRATLADASASDDDSWRINIFETTRALIAFAVGDRFLSYIRSRGAITPHESLKKQCWRQWRIYHTRGWRSCTDAGESRGILAAGLMAFNFVSYLVSPWVRYGGFLSGKRGRRRVPLRRSQRRRTRSFFPSMRIAREGERVFSQNKKKFKKKQKKQKQKHRKHTRFMILR